MKLLHTHNLPIFSQLQIEEALLRASDHVCCVINQGTTPAFVLGISSKVEEVIDLDWDPTRHFPIYRRFSGGGTVVVDEGTLFVTFIVDDAVYRGGRDPERLHQFFLPIYQEVFEGIPFCYRQNDYCIGRQKVGGNAQYFAKNRVLHHTSFLFSYRPERMSGLQMPPKMPQYRQERGHESFVTTLKSFYQTQQEVVTRLKTVLHSRFGLQPLEEVDEILRRPHRKSTRRIFRPVSSLGGG